MRPIPDDELDENPFERVIFDAPFDQRERWRNRDAGAPVEGPGDAAVTARNREPERGEENWVPVGPRSIGGRITSLAIDPGDGDVMYAGTAAGGVYKTIDRGESWIALWHDQRSLSIAGVDVSASNTDRIWVATGDAHPSGGGKIEGDGIYLSDDGGETWQRKGGTGTDGVDRGTRFDAIAADPSDDDFCFAVGDRGVYWTQNGGDDWERFLDDHTFTDVAYTSGPDPQLYIVAIGRRETVESFIIKIDDPRDTATGAIDLDLSDPANRNTIRPPGPPVADSLLADEHVIRGKVALTPADQDIVYAHFTRDYEADDGDTEAGHFALVRCDTATSTPWSDQGWNLLPPHPNWALLDTDGEPTEGQGGFNLTLAVDPTDADRLATGMVDLYVCTNGTDAAPDWRRAMAAELFMLDPAHHADHHAIAFGPERPDPALWVGNDGGIAVSSNWQSATDEYAPKRRDQSGTQTGELPADPVTWTRRGHGVDVPLPYSLAQSPIVPALYGCGFQDNGLHMTSGGLTWQQLLSADGGYIAFDADDPHQLLITWQGGIAHVDMPGRLDGTVPTPGLGVRSALWARKLRSGFFGTDGAQFVAPTAADPRVGGRAVHTRENRFYRSDPDTGGETWLPAPAGPVVDLICQPTSARTRVDVLPSAAARKLGLEPQRSDVGHKAVRVRTNTSERFSVAEGDQLELAINGTPHQITFASRVDDELNVASMTAAQLADEINRQSTAVPGFSANPGIRTWPSAVEVIADRPGGSIEVEPSSALAKLELTAGIYQAAPDHPAVLVVPARRDMQVVNDGDPPLELRLKIDGNAVPPIRFDPDHFSRLDFVYPDELATQVAASLVTAPARAEPVRSERGVHLITNSGVELDFTGTAREKLALPTSIGSSGSLRVPSTTDLSPMEHVLVVGYGATRRTVTFREADVADITQVRPDELVAVLQPALGDAGSAHVVGNEVEIRPTEDTIIAFSGTARAVLGLPETIDGSETIGPSPDLSPQDLTLSFREGANRADIVFHGGQPIADRTRTTASELHPIVDAALTGSGVSVTATLSVTTPRVLRLQVGNGHSITIEGTARGVLDLPPVAPIDATRTISGVKDLSPVDVVLEVGDGAGSVEIEFDGSHGVGNLAATTPVELAAILTAAFTADGIRAAAAAVGTTVEITPNGGITLTYAGTAVGILSLPASSSVVETIVGDQDLSARPARLSIEDPNAGINHDIDFDAAIGIVDRSKTQPMELLRILGQELAAAGLGATVTNSIEHEPGEGSMLAYDPERPGRVWVGCEDGLAYRSADGGASWTAAYPIPGVSRYRNPVAVAFHPTEDRTVYIGLSGRAVGTDDPGFLFRSEDDGFSWEAIGDDLDVDGELLDARALAVDPGEPDHLYVGTDVGVWRSSNRGRSWSEFNQGLPNVRVFDLAVERQTRTLRAALWGRPIHERRLGRRRSSNVALSIRANALDDGLTRPAPIGPDVFARQPRPVVQNESPDIKIVRVLPPTGFLDGVEFDELITSERPTPGPAHVAVQVNNRGAFPADQARAVVLYTDVSEGVPPLPDDLWSRFEAGALAGTVGPWEVALDETLNATPVSPRTRIGPGYPRVFTAAVNFPDEIERASRIGFLAFCSCPEDALETEEVDPSCLLAADRRFAYRELDVASAVDAETLHIVGRDRDQTFPFSVEDATAPSAMVALGLSTPLSPVDSITGGQAPFDLTTGAGDPGVTFTQPVRPVTIEIAPADFEDPGRVPRWRVIPVLNREFLQQGVPIQARSVPVLVGPDELRLEADSTAVTLEVTGGQLAGALGLAVGGGPTSSVATTTSRFALDRPGLTLDLNIHVEHTVRFPEALTTAAEIREVLDSSMEAARLPIRAEIPSVDLRVRRSATGAGTAADVTPRGGLADIVASIGRVDLADQAALFDLVTTLGDDVVGTGTSFLYVRASNGGTAEQADARLRLWEIKPAGAPGGPLSLDLIGESARTVPPGEQVIEEIEWTPDDPAPAEGQLRLVLAAIDHPADRPILTSAGDELDDDTEFADLEELHRLSRRNPGLAYREFRVGS